jgi:hypothetical protein
MLWLPPELARHLIRHYPGSRARLRRLFSENDIAHIVQHGLTGITTVLLFLEYASDRILTNWYDKSDVLATMHRLMHEIGFFALDTGD